MNLISGTHHLCERREYAFIILREYTIISLISDHHLNQLFDVFYVYMLLKSLCLGGKGKAKEKFLKGCEKKSLKGDMLRERNGS